MTKRNDAEMNCFDEIINADNFELLECIWPYTRYLKRSKQEAGHFNMIHIAAGSEGSKCLKFLIEKGENVNQLSNEFDRAVPLHFAVMA